jgi:tRNA pseudouridine55 synthase
LKKNSEGFLTVDKPAGVSSFSVVAAVRRHFGGVKTGHAGTLDPAASGLLVLALGNATRLLPFVPLEPKLYRFGVRFGVQTDTLDVDGTVIKNGGCLPPSEALQAVLPRFTGVVTQVPPEFSAVKVGGVRAYKLARQGRHMELASRRIEIFSLLLLGYDETAGQAEFETSCSGGTYIRSLARDIAVSLGTCGYASSVRRLAAGSFNIVRSLAFNELERAEEVLSPVHEVVRGLPRITVDAMQEKRIMQGNDMICEGQDDVVFAFDNENCIVAVLKKKVDGWYHPARVFISR